MDILTQIGIIILIVFILFVIIRSNKALERVEKEGENFGETWENHQARNLSATEEKMEQQETRIPAPKEKMEENVEPQKHVEPPKKMESPQEVPKQKTSERPEDFIQIKYPEEMSNVKAVKEENLKSRLILVRMDGNHQAIESVQVTKLPFTIGRSKENSMVLDDFYVAREHCRIIKKDGDLVLQDLGSTNKIFTDGKVCEECILHDKQKFYLGNEEILVQMG